jgi:transposase InsO family protein
MVIALYPRRTAKHTLDFIERVIEEMPFPIQCFQTDDGREFTAYKVQDCLLEWGIKFHPIRAAAPHLNGKVERAQKTVLDEFYPKADSKDAQLQERLEEWQFYYNWQRIHGSLGKTLMERCTELSSPPFSEEVYAVFDEAREREIQRNRDLHRAAKKVK